MNTVDKENCCVGEKLPVHRLQPKCYVFSIYLVMRIQIMHQTYPVLYCEYSNYFYIVPNILFCITLHFPFRIFCHCKYCAVMYIFNMQVSSRPCTMFSHFLFDCSTFSLLPSGL